MAWSQPQKLQLNKGFPFSLLSYNVNFGSFVNFDPQHPHICAEAQLVLQCIQQADADLVCLQETNEGWEYACNEFLSKQYPKQYFFHSRSGYYAAGIAFLHKENFKLEMVKTVNPKVDGSFFDGQLISENFKLEMVKTVNPKVDGSFFDGQLISGSFFDDPHSTSISIINVHLRPPLSMGNDDDGIIGNLDAYFRKSGPIHEQELQSLIKIFKKELKKEDLNLFVVGDFNEGSLGNGYQFLSNIGLTDTVSFCSDQTTWYWPVIFGQNIWGSYDHIFYDQKKFFSNQCKIWREYRQGSDHCAVLSKFHVSG